MNNIKSYNNFLLLNENTAKHTEFSYTEIVIKVNNIDEGIKILTMLKKVWENVNIDDTWSQNGFPIYFFINPNDSYQINKCFVIFLNNKTDEYIKKMIQEADYYPNILTINNIEFLKRMLITNEIAPSYAPRKITRNI